MLTHRTVSGIVQQENTVLVKPMGISYLKMNSIKASFSMFLNSNLNIPPCFMPEEQKLSMRSLDIKILNQYDSLNEIMEFTTSFHICFNVKVKI